MAVNEDKIVPPTGSEASAADVSTTATGFPNEKRATSVHSGHQNVTMIEMGDKDKDAAIATDKEADLLPSTEEQIEALGIADWRHLEKKIVRRLDITLMPCLWVLYLFNYLDRAAIAQARISTLDQDLGLTGDQFGSAVAVLSAGYVLHLLPWTCHIDLLQHTDHLNTVTSSVRSPPTCLSATFVLLYTFVAWPSYGLVSRLLLAA